MSPLSLSMDNGKTQPRRSPRLAHRPIVHKSCVCCGNTDLNGDYTPLKEKFKAVACSSRRKKKNSIPFLPGGMIFNILVWLPAEILYNVMRYVCREWYNVINSPEFINAHLQKSTNGLLIQHREHPEEINLVEINNCDVRIRKLRFEFSKRIRSSCDGLVLFHDDTNNLLFCVANLITKQILTLPPLFEPIRHSTFSALVYAHSIRRYKVVHVFAVNGLEFKCAIVIVGTETAWRLIDTKHIPNTDIYFSNTDTTLFAGGYVYWTPGSRACSYLLAFDVEAETMHKLPNPKLFIGKGGHFIVKESFLAFMVFKYFVWEVWALTELNKGSEWTRLYNIDLYGQSGMLNEMLHPQNGFVGYYLSPLVWLKNGKLVIFCVSDPSRTYIVYNIKTREVCSFVMGKDRNNIYYAHVNSLVSLKVC